MKTTIKKMIKFGLKKEDIKAEFGLNDEQFNRYEKQGKYMEVENLPELLEKYNTDKIIDSQDRERAELFDKLFRLANAEIPNLDTKQKSNMLSAFPNFINDIKQKVAEQEIEKLEEQINTIKEQINEICLENGIAVKYPTTLETRDEVECIAETLDGRKYNAFGEVIEEQKEEKQKGIAVLNYRDGIRAQSPHYKLGQDEMLFSLRKDILRKLDVGDIIIIKDGSMQYRYTIIKKTLTNKASYIKASRKQD